MRTLFRLLCVSVIVLAWCGTPAPPARAAALDTTADHVFGQPDFTHGSLNNGGLNANSLAEPFGVALDAQGNLYVADTFNNRVLEYDAPLTAGATADRVFGQPDFTHGTPNNGGISATSLWGPTGVAVDVQGNLYVADEVNSRVLEYDAPLTAGADTTADRVFGQPDFTHGIQNNGGITATSLSYPAGVAVDSQGNLYVADYVNNRVLEYDAPLTTDATADRVLGQPSFTANTPNNGGISASSLYFPISLALDAQGNLYVADQGNSRVLEYSVPLTTSEAAGVVFGQPDFTHNLGNNGGLSASSLDTPGGVALDAGGNLYVADTSNHRALEYGLASFKLYLPLIRR